MLKRKLERKMNRLFTILASLTMLTLSLSNKINKIHQSSGLYFDNLGLVKFSNQKYTLLTFTNLTHIKEQVNIAYNLYDNSLHICSKISTQYLFSDCNQQLTLLAHKLENIEEDFSIISHQIDSTRKRRGLFNAGGDLLSWLFGNPDADDAQFYTDSIKSILSNQKETHILMKKQIGIISSTIRNFNESAAKLSADAYMLNENLAKFDKFMQQTTTIEETMHFEIQINEYLLRLTEITTQIQSSLKVYLNSITLIRHGIIDFNVIHPIDLKSELEKIQLKFNLPLPPTLENTYLYYKMMDIKSFISQNLFITAIDIPIVEPNSYNLYKIYPLPTPHANETQLFSYIEPSAPYILVSATKTTYAMLNDLSRCKENQPSTWLCKDITVIQRSTISPSCEMQLFFNTSPRIPHTCAVKNLYAEIDIWHKTQPNHWLFILSKPTTLSILCRTSKDAEYVLQGLGIVQLDQDCKAYSDSIMLETETFIGSKNLTHKIPTLAITQDDCCVRLKENITNENIKLHPIKLNNLNLDELKFAQHKLSEIDEELQNQLNQPFVIKHANWFSTLISMIGTGIALIILYKILKWLRFFSILRRFTSCTKIDREAGDPQRNPCVQVFTHCFNNPTPHRTEFNVQFDAELERLSCPPSPLSSRPDSPRYETRRSTRSTAGKNTSVKVTSK